MRYVGLIAAAGVAAFAVAPALATQIPDGTVSVVGLFNPAVNLAVAPATYTATLGTTFEVSGTGGFLGVSGLLGSMNGTVNFSSTVGAVISQSLNNFFVFNDGALGTFNFSATSVRTLSFTNTPGVSSAISLYLLGSTVDANLGYSSTPTSLTLSFNSTGGSPYSTSATLAVPPTPTVPEPATWCMALIGFGAMGAVLRRRPRTSVSFA